MRIELDDCLASDRRRLKAPLRDLKSAQGAKKDKARADFEALAKRSSDVVQKRRAPAAAGIRRGPAGQHAAGRDRQTDRGASGRHRLRRDRFRQDDAAAQDLPRTRSRRHRPHRPHAAAPHRRALDRGTYRARTEDRTRQPGRLQDPFHRTDDPGNFRQADDRRHPARRDAGRSDALPVRHADHRRGA